MSGKQLLRIIRWSCAAVKVFDDAADAELRVAFDFDGVMQTMNSRRAVSRRTMIL